MSPHCPYTPYPPTALPYVVDLQQARLKMSLAKNGEYQDTADAHLKSGWLSSDLENMALVVHPSSLSPEI